MLTDIMSGDIIRIVISAFSLAIVLLICTPAHECAHALTAKLLGDDTAESMGRITLNPIAHFDLIGTIGMLLFGVGWAKPVPVNTTRCRKVKSRKTAMALTAAAGPVSNVLMALIFMIIAKVTARIIIDTDSVTEITDYIMWAFRRIIEINLGLAVFNLIPVPPLDGSRILFVFLPTKSYFSIMKYERYIMIAVLMLAFTGILDIPLELLKGLLYNGLNFITGFIC